MKLLEKLRKAKSHGGNLLDAPEMNAAATEQPNPKHKLLIIDDNPVVIKAFELKLGALGFHVLTATDGSSGVAMARSEHPDLIILDLNFPPDVGNSGLQWNGLNIIQWLHRLQNLDSIPVIIITSTDPALFRDKALAAGALAFFQKPIDFEQLLVTIYRALGSPAIKNQSLQT